MQQRRLSGSGRAHYGDELSFFDLQIDSAQNISSTDAVLIESLKVLKCDHRPPPPYWPELDAISLLSSTTRPSKRCIVRSAWRAKRGSWVTMQMVAPPL